MDLDAIIVNAPHMKALGAGKDNAPVRISKGANDNPTGWIRLDPTNAHVPNFTANDKDYITSECY